jgi:hypothetical protein
MFSKVTYFVSWIYKNHKIFKITLNKSGANTTFNKLGFNYLVLEKTSYLLSNTKGINRFQPSKILTKMAIVLEVSWSNDLFY